MQINVDNIESVTYNGQEVEHFYVGSSLVWEKSDEPIPAPAPPIGSNPLIFSVPPPMEEGEEGGEVEIWIEQIGTPTNNKIIYYSTDYVNWFVYKIGKKLTAQMNWMTGEGNEVCFYSPNTLPMSESQYTYKHFRTSAPCHCGGDLQALMNWSDTLTDGYCYTQLFGCISGTPAMILTAPELTATTLYRSCYDNMFRGCLTLEQGAYIHATTLAVKCCESMYSGCRYMGIAFVPPAPVAADNCFGYMFENCTSLQNVIDLEGVSVLPAGVLATKSYYRMFYGCTGLYSAPLLPTALIASDSYKEMFRNCTSLNEIHVAPSNLGQYSSQRWVENIAQTGDIYFTDPSLFNATVSSDYAPEGWTYHYAPYVEWNDLNLGYFVEQGTPFDSMTSPRTTFTAKVDTALILYPDNVMHNIFCIGQAKWQMNTWPQWGNRVEVQIYKDLYDQMSYDNDRNSTRVQYYFADDTYKPMYFAFNNSNNRAYLPGYGWFTLTAGNNESWIGCEEGSHHGGVTITVSDGFNIQLMQPDAPTANYTNYWKAEESYITAHLEAYEGNTKLQLQTSGTAFSNKYSVGKYSNGQNAIVSYKLPFTPQEGLVNEIYVHLHTCNVSGAWQTNPLEWSIQVGSTRGWQSDAPTITKTFHECVVHFSHFVEDGETELWLNCKRTSTAGCFIGVKDVQVVV